MPEPQDFFLASQVKFEDLTKDLRKLKRQLEGNGNCSVIMSIDIFEMAEEDGISLAHGMEFVRVQ